MKEITLKEWSAYLPYGLKVKVTDNPCADEIHELSGIPYDGLLHLGKGGMYGFKRRNFKQVKPILYDLSWLTREITHEGETFVPLLNLVDPDKSDWDKMECLEFQAVPNIPQSQKWFKVKHLELGEVIQINPFNLEVLPHKLFQKLIEWKFNAFNLPDELIVRVTEDFNPYK